MSEILAYPKWAYQTIQQQYGFPGLFVAGVGIVVLVIFIFIWFDRRK